MKHMVRRIVFALCIAALPLAAAAQQAFTVRDVEVFAGPSSEYPPIAELPPGSPVQLAGCLSDWSWCDVIFANDRGWVYAGDLSYPYQGSRVVILEYGPRLRLPVVTFSLVTYWDAHYRARPWFRQRDVWVNRVRIEANRGGPPPHGRQAQTRPEGGAQQPAQRAQPAQPAQPQAARPAPPQAAQPEQRPERSARPAQPVQPQGSEAARPQEPSAKQQLRPQPEAGQAQGDQRERRARPAEENAAQAQGMREQLPTQAPQARQAPSAGRQPETMHAPEANKEKASEGKRTPDRERPKEESQ